VLLLVVLGAAPRSSTQVYRDYFVGAGTTGIQAGDSLGNLLAQFQDRLGDRVELSLVPSTPAAPLVAGHTLFYPADIASWMERWTATRPDDGDPLQMLMAPSDEAFKRAPLIIEPASGAPADSASLSAWCEKHREMLEAATDVCGALLFRGWGLDEIDDYEACMAGLGACLLLETISAISLFGVLAR
jgi:hypothetical protein